MSTRKKENRTMPAPQTPQQEYGNYQQGAGANQQPQYQQPQQQYQYAPGQEYNAYRQYQQPYSAPMPQQPYGQQPMTSGKSKVAAGILGILLGAFGAHKFYLGYTTEAIIMLLVSLLTFGIGGVVMEVIGIVEGVIYLTKTDYDFERIYGQGHKGWF